MAPAGVGIVLDSFGQPAREALQTAARLAFQDVELPAVAGDVDPANLSRTRPASSTSLRARVGLTSIGAGRRPGWNAV